MALWNLGSITADMVYALPHLPGAGETLAATGLDQFLGGKGANMSVAAARAGAHVHHIGAVGPEGGWAVARLMEYGVDTRPIAKLDAPSSDNEIDVPLDPSPPAKAIMTHRIGKVSGTHHRAQSGTFNPELSPGAFRLHTEPEDVSPSRYRSMSGNNGLVQGTGSPENISRMESCIGTQHLRNIDEESSMSRRKPALVIDIAS